MHILIGILTVLGVIAFFIIRANQAGQAARELADTVGDVRRFGRRHSWNRVADRATLDLVDEPVLAAAAMMCAVAAAEGVLTERHSRTISSLIAARLGVGGRDGEELFAQGRWLAGQTPTLGVALDRLSVPITKHCDAAERADLIDMLRTVAKADGPPSAIQSDAIGNLARKLGIA